MGSIEKFSEGKLPDRSKFYGKMNVLIKKIIYMLIMFGTCLK